MASLNMADILPFKGTLYNREYIKDISKVVAPPYDVISPEEQTELYNSDPHNIIRIMLGKEYPGDNEKENKYTRAKAFLNEWLDRGILKKDRENSIYIYLQEFKIDGQTKERLGFISLLKLEDFDIASSNVYPHENTLIAPKEDRSKLIASIEANLGPIFALFADEDKFIDAILLEKIGSRPLIEISDYHGIRNKLWRISDRETLEEIMRLMKAKKLFIADGHHRYEVALAFSKSKNDPKYGYILTYFTDLYGDGIVILPVHRLISGVDEDILTGFQEDLKRHFRIEELSSIENIKVFLSGAAPFEKRFVIRDNYKFTGLSLKNNNSLDVSVLHDLIVGPLQKKVEKRGKKILIDFTKDLNYAIKMVDNKNFSLSIMLNPTKATEVRDVAFSGKRMPQKSTYFYPKVLTGLVINVF
jgi:uncharacterized protein (DUF1015 family)